MKKSNMEKRGFSLIEMMLVLAVVAILMAFAAPNLFSLISSSTLTSQGALVRNQLTFAQQLAVSRSTDVEVRFFKLTDFSAAQTVAAFRGFQLFQYDQTGVMTPISEFFRIRAPIAVHPSLSTLLQAGVGSTAQDKKFGYDSPRKGTYKAPAGQSGALISTQYVSFRFRPDGGTDLPAKAGGDTWYLTLVQGENTLNLSSLGSGDNQISNYVCLQVNPHNGQITEFRP